MGFAVGDTFFGLSEEDLQTRLDLAASIGASLLRLDFSMYRVRADGPRPDQYSWGELDHIVESADRRKLGLLGLLAYTPNWAKDPASTERTSAPRNVGDFVDFAKAAAQRYPKINLWEVWNEPNLGGFWENPSPEAYAKLFVPTAAALHQVNPGNKVSTGGLAVAATDGENIDALEFLDRFLATKPTGMDAIGMHPYTANLLPSKLDDWSPWQRIEGNPKLPTTPSLNDILKKYGLDLPFWLTEYGAPSGGKGENVVSEAQQAAMIKEALTWKFQKIQAPIRLIFNLSDGYADPKKPDEVNDPENYFGVYHVNNKPKPAAAAFQSVPK